MSWFTKLFLRSKPTTGTSSDDAVIIPKPITMDPEYNFLCGICHGYLIDPRMCPFCRYKSCEKCFEAWFQQCSRIKFNKLSHCPQCNEALDQNSLICIPSLHDLDRKYHFLDENNKILEDTLADLLVQFTSKIEKMEIENGVKLNEIRKSFDEHIQAHLTQVAIGIEEMNSKQNVPKPDIGVQTFLQNIEIGEPEISEKGSQTALEIVSDNRLEISPTNENQKPTNSSPKQNIVGFLQDAMPLPGCSHFGLSEKRKLSQNDVPKKVSKICKPMKKFPEVLKIFKHSSNKRCLDFIPEYIKQFLKK